MLEYANKNSLKLEEVKARLAETVMKLNTQVELSRDAMAVSLHKDNKRAAGRPSRHPRNPPDARKPVRRFRHDDQGSVPTD